MNRRSMLYGGVAAAAGLAGVGVAWWKGHSLQDSPTQGQGGNASSTGSLDAFWSLAFDRPDGQSLAMSSFRGKPLLVNFWATWCPPCVEELPLLDSFYNTHKGKDWQLLGLAVDQPSAVRKWLQTRPLGFPVGMAGFNGTELSKSLGNTAGSLPFSVLFGTSGQILQRKVGKLTQEDLDNWRKSV